MTSPLVSYYDRLVAHDWFYDYAEDASVVRRGQAERSDLQRQAQQGPAFQALYDAYHAFIHDENAPQPPRPSQTAAVAPPPPPVDRQILADLDDADQARVHRAVNPAAELAQIQARQALDATLDLPQWLARLGGVPTDPAKPVRWVFPDQSQVTVRGAAWIHLAVDDSGKFRQFIPQATGTSVVALIGTIQGLKEAQAMAVARGDTQVAPVAGVPSAAPSPPPSSPAPLSPPSLGRFASRMRR